MPTHGAGDPSEASRRTILAVCIAMAVVGVNATAIGVATRGIEDELRASLRELEWIMGAYLVAAAAFALIGGRMGDVVGRTRTFMIGCGIFVGGCLLAALAPGTAVLIVARAVQGFGAALIMPASIEVVASHPSRRGPNAGFRARGVVYASAFGIGPLIGGVLTDTVSWRAVFWCELVGLFAAIVVAFPLLRATSRLPRPPTRDFLGGALAAIIVFLVVLIASRGNAWGWSLWPTGVLVVLTLTLGAVLVWVETHAEHPLIHGWLLRDRTVMGANVATLGASIGMLGLIYFFNVFAQSSVVFESTAIGVAFALIPFTLSIIVFALVAGSLARRLGFRGPVIVGLGLSVIGFAWLATITVGTTEVELLVPLALCGVGAGIANAGLTTPAVMTHSRRIDEAAGLVSLTRFLGSAIAIAIGTASFLAVAISPPGRGAATDPAATALGGSAYAQAVATLRVDLRRPFEAATREATVHAFTNTMRLAAVTLTVLMFISAVLLAHSNPDDGQAAPEPV
jgi:MFS transporter, DHA2 family, methylenomycin A resistance protein